MNAYEKPIISVDAGMAEGVYAASGSDSHGFEVAYQSKNVYYQENGAITYRVSWTSGNVQSFTLVFNQDISSASANTSAEVSGKSVTFTYSGWNPSSPVDVTVVVSTGLSTLELVSYSYVIN